MCRLRVCIWCAARRQWRRHVLQCILAPNTSASSVRIGHEKIFKMHVDRLHMCYGSRCVAYGYGASLHSSVPSVSCMLVARTHRTALQRLIRNSKLCFSFLCTMFAALANRDGTMQSPQMNTTRRSVGFFGLFDAIANGLWLDWLCVSAVGAFSTQHPAFTYHMDSNNKTKERKKT